MAQGQVETLFPIGTPVVYLELNGHRKYGVIEGYNVVNGRNYALFKENVSALSFKWVKQVLHLSSRVKSVPIQGLHALRQIGNGHNSGFRDTNNNFQPKKQNSQKTIIYKARTISVSPVKLDDIQVGDFVVWNPKKDSLTENSFPGEIEELVLNISVVNESTYYANVKFSDEETNNSLRSYSEIKFQKFGDTLATAWILLTDLWKVGDYIDCVVTPTSEVDASSRAEGLALRKCQFSSWAESNNSDVPKGTKIIFTTEQVLGSVVQVYFKEENEFWAATHFEKVVNDEVLPHHPNCNQELECRKMLMINIEKLLKEEDNKDKFFMIIKDKMHVEPKEVESKSSIYSNMLRKCTNDANGIQGSANSCYLDTSLFIMFAFTTSFDSILLENKFSNDEHADLRKNIQENLKKIATQLRQELRVPAEMIWELRRSLSEIRKEYVDGSFMDAEELLLNLFDCFGTRDFFEFSNGASDRIHQIFATNESHEREFLKVKDLDTMFKDSLLYNEITLEQLPNPVIILKLPFCDGKPMFGCEMVLPNLYMEFAGKGKMELFGVICLKMSHYVCFAKNGDELLSPWVYFDSSPVNGCPKMQVVDEFAKELGKVEEDYSVLAKNQLINTNHLMLLCKFSYLCFYR